MITDLELKGENFNLEHSREGRHMDPEITGRSRTQEIWSWDVDADVPVRLDYDESSGEICTLKFSNIEKLGLSKVREITKRVFPTLEGVEIAHLTLSLDFERSGYNQENRFSQDTSSPQSSTPSTNPTLRNDGSSETDFQANDISGEHPFLSKPWIRNVCLISLPDDQFEDFQVGGERYPWHETCENRVRQRCREPFPDHPPGLDRVPLVDRLPTTPLQNPKTGSSAQSPHPPKWEKPV